ncbi:MAG TPA: DNA helicase Rep [Thiothrix sp.]|nr:DNA helicase Rep [Thiothrix sp.]
MSKLNPQQQAAVEHLGSPLMVLAGAGSGKTRVITHKIAWLIRTANIPAYHIAAITFTNKAAREMQQRASQLLEKEEGKGLLVSTFHTLGLMIIRQELKALGYKSGFSIFDAQDSTAILKSLAQKEDTLADDDQASHWQISRWKNDFISPEQAFALAKTPTELTAAKRYEHYQRQLKAYNAVDFDDLIVLPTQLFSENPDILQRWQYKLRYLLIDEYQDTNACQYRLIRLLAGINGALTAVGDDDQSIYAWRGAQPENIHLLKQDYPTLKVIKLEQNYRSTVNILHTANHLIANNPHLFEKHLWSDLGEGKNIKIIPCRTADHEAEKVIAEILTYRFREKMAFKDIAILYRSNHQSRVFERLLRDNHIPYKITGGTSFFERAEVKDTLAYVRLLANPNDDAAFLRIVNTPKREIGVQTLEKLGTYATERGVSLLQASGEIGFSTRISERARANLERFTDWLHETIRETDDLPPHHIVQHIITSIDYEDYLLNLSSSPKVAEARMKNVQEVIAWMQRLYDDGNGKESLSEIVAHLTLVDILERNNDEKPQDQVSLMTLHAAKGLEFPCVFMIGVEEDLLPHANSVEADSIEEERRLMYVGITRAQQYLTISYAKTRQRYGEEMTCDPSRFLNELPEKYTDWQDRQNQQPSLEERQATANAYIDNLTALLGD